MSDYKSFDLPLEEDSDSQDSRSEIMTLCGLSDEAPVFDHGDMYDDSCTYRF